jgi:hypothetical protein
VMSFKSLSRHVLVVDAWGRRAKLRGNSNVLGRESKDLLACLNSC